MSLESFYSTFLKKNPLIQDYIRVQFGQALVSEAGFTDQKAWFGTLIQAALLKNQPALRRDLAKLLDQHKKVVDAGDRQGEGIAEQKNLEQWLIRCLASIEVAASRWLCFGGSDEIKCANQQIQIADSLPVGQQAAEIADLLEKHQVLVIAGETGSGKTTQLPKICARLGRGVQGRIGHTQPRRLAARTVAARIAEELNVELGEQVGYQFRFESRFKDSSRIKLMTDGILLSAINHDRLLLEYDTIIIDEAHERSLTIDFLLGYLKTILPRRPDLKIIITSATIDVQRFARFFASDDTDAPVVLVEGRSYKVHQHYLGDEEAEQALELDELIGHSIEQIEEQEKKQSQLNRARDILVFLPGEREIRDVRQYLQDRFVSSNGNSRLELLPLYARLSRAEQNRLFQQSNKLRRVVLATNVAETSITVPNIGYVIDSGLARVSRYSARSKLQRLQVEKISQASANQRAGRCGRIAEGRCYRLYTESDFNQRAEFTDPEILRTHLAEVILQMTYLRLGNIESFPFVDRPDGRQVKAGLKTLEEIGALEGRVVSEKLRLSGRGKKLARLPLDPRLAVMLLVAQKHGVLSQMLVIVSALAVVDPRDFPEQKRQAARQAHARFADKRSDFLSWLNLWHYVERQREKLSSSQWRKRAKQEFLSWIRLREWREVHRQLLLGLRNVLGKELSSEFAFQYDENRPEGNLRGDWRSSYEKVHRSLLAGLYSQFGLREEPQKRSASSGGKPSAPTNVKDQRGLYRGARNRRFYINPGSELHKKNQRWIIAAEIVETKKVFARTVAAIEPHWLSEELSHLIKHNYAEPAWDIKRGQVLVSRSSKLYGITVAANQRVACDQYDKQLARKIFIQDALVNRNLAPDRRLEKLASFWTHNEAIIEKVLTVEAKLRRRDIMLDESIIASHYEANLPQNIWSRNTLSAVLKGNRSNQKNNKTPIGSEQLQQSLMLSEAQLQLSNLDGELQQYPSAIVVEGERLVLRYSFSPGEDADGVSCGIPLAVLQALPPAIFEWLVPGMLLDKVIAMIKALPKAQRRALVPEPQVAQNLLSYFDLPVNLYATQASASSNRNENIPSLYAGLAKQIQIHYGLKLNSLDWQQLCTEQLDPVYHMRFEVVDETGKLLGAGRDLAALQKEFRQRLRTQLEENQQSDSVKDSTPVKEWKHQKIGQSVLTKLDGISVKAYPVLKDTGDAVLHSYEIDEAKAFSSNRAGVLRLAMLELVSTTRYLKKQLYRNESELLGLANVVGAKALREQTIQAAIAESCFGGFRKGLPNDELAFKAAISQGRGGVVTCAQKIEEQVLLLAKELHKSRQVLEAKQAHFPAQKADIDLQLGLLLPADFCIQTPVPRLQDLVRYIKAIGIRMDRIGGNQKKDNEYCEKLSSYQQNLHKLLYTYVEALNFDEELRAFRWLLEELRVALFAQQLKTREPASFARLEKAWQRIDLHRYPEAM